MTTPTLLAPVHINGHTLQPHDEIHARKLEALRVFVQHLLASPARDQIAKIILFGSVAKGEAKKDSDVDVMVFGFRNLQFIEDVSSEYAYDTMLEMHEYISPLVEDATDLFDPQSYLTYLVTRRGQEAYVMSKDDLTQREIEDRKVLAEEYLRAAENAYQYGHRRLAADGAYNAAEACAKGLLLLKMDDLPSTHSGIQQKFGEHYVKDGPAPRELGGRLHRGLIIRGDARYKPAAQITEEMVKHNLSLAREMIAFVESTLKSLEK